MVAPTAAELAAQRSPATHWSRWLFRGMATVATVMLFDQAVLAGQFLAGSYNSLRYHRENATYAGLSVVACLIAAVLLRWKRHGPGWPIVAYTGLFGLVALQIAVGFARLLSLHVPLGVAIILIAAALAAWSWKRP
jgi:heme A synthase